MRWFVVSVCLACGLAGAARAFAETVASMPSQPAGYVTDDAGVLSATAKAELEAYCSQLEQKAHAQVFTAIVKSIDGDEPVEKFSNELFAKWKVGTKSTNRGVLLVFSIQDRKRWIEIGFGLEGILNDAKVGDIGRQMVPSLAAKQYDEAVQTGVQGVGAVIAADANVTIDSAVHRYRREAVRKGDPGPMPAGVRILGLLFLVVVLFLVFRRRGGGGGYGGGGPGGFLAGIILGNLLGGGGRGGFGGGDGGNDDGGGFGGGGGGESGGGGAGGGW